MAENHENTDLDLAKAKKSMGWRVDPDEETDKPKEEPVEEPKAPEDEPEKVEVPKEEPVIPADTEPKEPPKKVERPEAFIPLAKYHNEKREWEDQALSAKKRADELEAKVAELTQIANQNDGADKDEDIKEFMANTGFDKETVESFLKLVGNRVPKGDVMSEEQRENLAKATAIVKEKEMEEYFNNEFKTIGEASLLKIFPKATPEKLAQAKDYLSKVAHTKENHSQPLDFIVFKNQEELAKIFVDEVVPAPDNKGPINYKIGNGKTTSYTAKDFKDGSVEFSALADLDQADRSKIIRDMDSETYNKYVAFHKDSGVSVMRNGKKINLK